MAKTVQGRLYSDVITNLSPALLDERFRARGFQALAGVDEVGRGPLAGPVVAAAVILPPGTVLNDVTDSKRLSPNARRKQLSIIFNVAVSVGIGIVEADEIDRINILQASLLAMKKAVTRLNPQPDVLLIDGEHGIHDPMPQFPIIKGDRRSQSIAAASIVAKVTRDGIMCRYHKAFPKYGFDRHKGYATPEHVHALRTYGCCRIHRRTFRGVCTSLERYSQVSSIQKSFLR